MMDFFEKYEKDLATGGRSASTRLALDLLLEKGGSIIVETGTTRMKEDWGGGMFTLVAGDFCKNNTQFHLFTVDIDHEAIETCAEVTKEFNTFITYVVSDSVNFLKKFDQKIDLLYLDSMDCPQYDDPESLNLIKSQLHQLREFETAIAKLADRAIILLDDNGFDNGGKTRLTKMFLKDRGYHEVMSGKQSLWTTY